MIGCSNWVHVRFPVLTCSSDRPSSIDEDRGVQCIQAKVRLSQYRRHQWRCCHQKADASSLTDRLDSWWQISLPKYYISDRRGEIPMSFGGMLGDVSRGVQYVHWVMHKCIMVKVGGEIQRKYVKSWWIFRKQGGNNNFRQSGGEMY